jgi:hypothetical protein
VLAFRDALFAGWIVSSAWVADMVRPRSVVPSQSMRCGLGFWLHASTDAVMPEGCDIGVSFRSVRDPDSGLTHTTIPNMADGAWPISLRLDELRGV